MVETSHVAGFWPSLYEPLRQMGHKVADWFAPASEAGMQEDAYKIDLELPGVKQDDIDISLHKDVLTVKGEKRAKREQKTGPVYFCERQYGTFQRSFRLPPDADGEGVVASFTDGLLSLTVPRRKPEAPEAKKIAIKTA